jgi:arsenate reductase
MAAAFLNAFADPGKARAISAGSSPAERVHPEVVRVMREVGIDLSEAEPRRLTAELARGASVLVTMGCGDRCPVQPGTRTIEWEIEDPNGRPLERVREIRDEIRRKVLELARAEGIVRTTFMETL